MFDARPHSISLSKPRSSGTTTRMIGRPGKTRWIALFALVFFTGCAMNHPDQPQLAFMEVPPAVRAAFLMNYRSATVEHITCEIKGNQYVYNLTYVDNDHKSHTVVLNEGGDEIDRY
jgi:hypothetical protein